MITIEYSSSEFNQFIVRQYDLRIPNHKLMKVSKVLFKFPIVLISSTS